MEEAKEVIKKVLKRILKPFKRIIALILVGCLLIFLILAPGLYFITVDDGTYKEDDWSSTPYGAASYVNGTNVNGDGSISSNTTAQELWDKMLENGCRVDEYLKSPEELARLMKAEIVTQFPDTRPNPEEEINWEDIVNNADILQGIIKFKRADSDGNKSTMSYVDPATFQSYIDEYNSSGSETAKQNALSHFTLKKSTGSTATGNNGGAVAAGEGVMTSISQAIIDAANASVTPWPGAQWCLKWTDDVYDNAGVPACRHNTAYLASQHHLVSTDMSAIPIGATVYGTGSGTTPNAGHVGIYIGGGQVIDSQNSGIVVSTLENWLSWQVDVIDGKQGWLGWGWGDGNLTRGTTDDPSLTDYDPNEDSENEEDDGASEDTERAVEVNVAGDGYDQEYISSAGIRYKHFKQIKGSYSSNPYWSGTIRSDGCGPTSVAILASGLTSYNYTPADTAAQMNTTYGYTSAENLKGEMDSLGMPAEIIYSPSAQEIQDNLRNGKVMLVSVNSNTIFTGGSHIMAIVDINTQGQVYICNPSSDTLYGWYDVNELMRGCDYIVVTDAGAAGIANSTNDSSYVAVVATWRQVDTTITTNDPNVNAESSSQYTMTTTDINYEEMVDPYTMPFDLLWALLVVGEDRNFIFEIADLIYNSDIQITIHDNLTINRDVDEWHYTQRTKAIVNATITAECNDITVTGQIENDIHDPHSEVNYTTTKTVVTQTNTISTALTRANVWIVDYQNDYTYVAPTSTTTTDTNYANDQPYPESPSSTDDSYSCEHIDAKREELEEEAEEKSRQYTPDQGTSATTYKATSHVEATAEYYNRYVDIYDNITNTVRKQVYIKGTPTLKEKTDKRSEEPNFVTIFNKYKYHRNKSNIKSASSWLFEIIETNDSTKDMLDLIKYLLYKATGVDYGVTEFDFSIFYPGGLTTVGEGDYIVDTTMSASDIVITDLNTLKQAFSGYSNDRVLQQYAYYFLECQERYHVNAVFAAAVSITESSAGTNIAIGGNNMFSISNGGQRKLE